MCIWNQLFIYNLLIFIAYLIQSHHPFHHYYFPFQKVQIRLSGGRSKLDGRIEILPPGQSDWGVICGDYWTIKEAMVACRHFGVGYAQQASKV